MVSARNLGYGDQFLGTNSGGNRYAHREADVLATASPAQIRKCRRMTINTYSPHRLGIGRVLLCERAKRASKLFGYTKKARPLGRAFLVGLSGELRSDCFASPNGELHALVVLSRAESLNEYDRLDLALGLADENDSPYLGLTVELPRWNDDVKNLVGSC